MPFVMYLQMALDDDVAVEVILLPMVDICNRHIGMFENACPVRFCRMKSCTYMYLRQVSLTLAV
jgi:hypothetical protein